MMMVNEVKAIAAKVEKETDVRRLRRWCVALLQDIGEQERKLASLGAPVDRSQGEEDSPADGAD